MKSDEEPRLFNDWDFLTGKALVAFVVIYNGLGVSIVVGLWGQENMLKVLICTAGYATLLFLLGLRLSSGFRGLGAKPERNNDKLLSSLTFPIIMWIIIPTIFLVLPRGTL
ncbi:MAG: hypothetical protein R3242_04040 [Akkermansiaceae bacterium]|nr:hypothetical protein [Akkermansiaceae bacterium]